MGLSDLIAGGMDATAATELLLNVVWTIVGATLVYFMQAGFAMCEAGFTRAKNTGNILMKNMMDFVLGSLFFFIFGFAIMHGTDWNGIIGVKGFFNPTTLADADGLFNGLPIGVFLIFHTVFCATAATIVSGSMAERTKFISYLLYSAAISIFIYPVTGHWIWSGGWLSQMGFHDFAGSTAVHMVGGICALVGAKILGPRIGKYDKEGNVRAIPGHNLSIAGVCSSPSAMVRVSAKFMILSAASTSNLYLYGAAFDFSMSFRCLWQAALTRSPAIIFPASTSSAYCVVLSFNFYANLENLFSFGFSSAFGATSLHLEDTVIPKSAAPCLHCLKKRSCKSANFSALSFTTVIFFVIGIPSSSTFPLSTSSSVKNGCSSSSFVTLR